MPNYLRAYVPGGTYFLTAALADRRKSLLVEQVDAMRRAFVWVRRRHPFETVAVVILPDHFHTIWTLPDGDADFSVRMKLLKESFSRSLPKTEHRSASRQRSGERGIWQRRYWEHAIRDERDLQAHVDYIHFNPVKHDLVATASGWPYSSFHRYVREGLLANDWAGPGVEATSVAVHE